MEGQYFQQLAWWLAEEAENSVESLSLKCVQVFASFLSLIFPAIMRFCTGYFPGIHAASNRQASRSCEHSERQP
jgi:hypothetical protein